jgi:hypothetical protein
MSLINMVFERPSHERDIPFSDMAERTRLPLEQVGCYSQLSLLLLVFNA